MNKAEFKYFRKKLNKTQIQLSQLLGTSIKAVHSYEQGWRTIPAAVQRQIFFLVSRMRKNNKGRKSCWVIKKCTPERKKQCPAWEFQAGTLCWFINGTMCSGKIHNSWEEKMDECKECKVFKQLFKNMNKKEFKNNNG